MAISHDQSIAIRNDVVRMIREAFGLHEIEAVAIANEIAVSVTRRISGVHIPAQEIKRARNEAIIRDFNGRNHTELARRYNVSKRRVYEILCGKKEKSHNE